jgi:membrane protein DedA with SNARE-associated domain
MTHLIVTYGLGAVFAAVALESAGVPVPGEASLIAASALASQGYFNMAKVIGIAAMAAIVGDNFGYWAGRWGLRRLLGRSALIRRYAERVVPKAERFFARHGGSTVFLARFITGLRVSAAWLAGMSHMDWRRFLLWNAAGGVVWATVVGLAGYLLGDAALAVLLRYHWLAAAAVLLAIAAGGAIVWWKRQPSQRA